MMNSVSVCLLVSGGLGLTLLKHIALKNNCNIHSVFTEKNEDDFLSCKICNKCSWLAFAKIS